MRGEVRLWGRAQRRAVVLWGGRDPAEGLRGTGLGPGADRHPHRHFPSELCRSHRRPASSSESAADTAQQSARVRQTCSGIWYLYKQRGWFSPLRTSYQFSYLFYQQLRHLPSLPRLLRLVWSGWWLCTTLLEIPKETSPFSREIAFLSAAILILGGAAVDSMAERGFFPGLLLRVQVRPSHQSSWWAERNVWNMTISIKALLPYMQNPLLHISSIITGHV